MHSFHQPHERGRGRRSNVSRGRGGSRNYVSRGRGASHCPQERRPGTDRSWIVKSSINHKECEDGKEIKTEQNEYKTGDKIAKHTSSKYIPPHLRGRGVNCNRWNAISGNTADPNHNRKLFKWYKNEQEFEAQLGHSLQSFKLNMSSFVDQNKVNQFTHCTTAPWNQSDAKLICVFGPPAVGKSTVFKYYLASFGVQNELNAVNSDGDIVRKAHYGINHYLQKSTQLNIGYDGFFRHYVQKWSEKWKIEMRHKAMKQRQHIIAFSTCHKSENCIKEMETFIANGYAIKILIVCAEYDICNEMGLKREKLNGRKHLNGAFCKSLQGIMDVVDYLAKYRQINVRNDVIVVRNKYTLNEKPPRLSDEWINIKRNVLIPMRKRAIHQIFKTYNH